MIDAPAEKEAKSFLGEMIGSVPCSFARNLVVGFGTEEAILQLSSTSGIAVLNGEFKATSTAESIRSCT